MRPQESDFQLIRVKDQMDHGVEGRDILIRVAGTIEKYNLLQGGETVLVGLSGGPDSVCLLSVLCRLRAKMSLKLHAVYVNHNLRPEEIPAEIAFCRNLCANYDVGFMVKEVDVLSYAGEQGLSRQEAARELRQKVFHEAASGIGAGKIALAHNADDQIETFFLRFIRGAGPKGLAGILPQRGAIIRPLIEIDRDFIERFLASENISFVTDSSNLKPDYLRNRIRQSIMPLMKEINPSIVHTVTHTMSILRDEERYFDILVTRTLMKLISRKTSLKIELFLAPLVSMDRVLLRRVLRRAIDETRGLRGISFEHIEDIADLIKTGRNGSRIYLPKGVRVLKEYSLLIITTEVPVKMSTYELRPQDKVFIKEAGIVIEAAYEEKGSEFGDGRSTVLLDAGALRWPLLMRPRVKGDFFYPMGFGKRKKLQDFFVDEKVPREDRDQVPLVVSGEEIVWIAGYRADDRYRITDKTDKFLRLTMMKGSY